MSLPVSAQAADDDVRRDFGSALCMTVAFPGSWQLSNGETGKGAAMLLMGLGGAAMLAGGYVANDAYFRSGRYQSPPGTPLVVGGAILNATATIWSVSDVYSRDWSPVPHAQTYASSWRPGDSTGAASDFFKPDGDVMIEADPGAFESQEGEITIQTASGPAVVRLQQPIAVQTKVGSLQKGFLDAVGGGFIQLRRADGYTWRLHESHIESVVQF